MINKFMVFSALFLLQATNATSFTQPLGSETCLSVDKITHQPGSAWQISTDSSVWNVLHDNKDSTLQFSIDTPVERTVEPYHNKLAIVTCHYAGDTLVLKHTYEEGHSPYPDANYIAADSNVDSKGNFSSIFYNKSTWCHTTIGALDKCPWFFLQEINNNDVPYGFYGARGWL